MLSNSKNEIKLGRYFYKQLQASRFEYMFRKINILFIVINEVK